LDGKKYYAAFPDENPANKQPILYYRPNLIAAFRELERQLQALVSLAKVDGGGFKGNRS
jgi:hypothetical protein